jgi:hypothetical protein
MAIARAAWLKLIDGQYLASFITHGGAAVKFVVVGGDAEAQALEKDLDGLATQHRMARAAVDSAVTRLHMIQDLFFAVARQVDWPALAQRFIEKLCADNGYAWPRPGQPVPITDLAAHNQVDPITCRNRVDQWLASTIMRDTGMVQDFRLAMRQLCLARLGPPDRSDSASSPVIKWLQGDLPLIGALKPAGIQRKVTRDNARGMLCALVRWHRLTGQHQGLILTLDIRRVALALPVGTAGVRYMPASEKDAYEVLRQMIDEADHFEGLLLVVVAGDPFLPGDPKRGIDSYFALKMRIWDDVRDRDRDNPLAPLVRLEAGA